MNGRTGIRFQTSLVVLLALSVGFPQVRQTPRRTAPARASAPFLKQAKSYEETPYVTKVVLKNGLTVLINEFRTQPVVSIQANVLAGYLDEPSQSPGIASLLAAMVCRGVPDKTQNTLRRHAQALGGLLKCTTDHQNTQFEIVEPSSQWKKALQNQTEALFNPSLNEEELKLEARRLADEARGILNEPHEMAAANLLELGFRQPRIKKWETLASGVLLNLTPANVSAFHKAMYVPARIMLVISGDVSSGEVLNEVVKIYSLTSAPGKKPAVLPLETRQNEFRYGAMEGNVPVARLLFGFHAVPGNSKDYMALQVLSAILGTGEGSILAARLRDQKKLILTEETKLMTYPDFGYLTVQVEARPEDIDRSEIALLTEMELLKRDAPGEADMERALALLERAYWESLETVTERARTLAHFETMGDWKWMDRYIQDIRQVKPSDVKRVADKYLRLENCSLFEYLPASGNARKPTPEGVRDTLEGLLTPSADQEQAQRDKEVVLAVKIPQVDESFKFSEIRYPFQTASILRGPDMFIREDHTTPLIDMAIFFPGGRLAENEGNSGITRLMTRLMIRGAGDKSAAQFFRQLEVYGGQVRPVVTPDYFGFHFSILSKNFEAGFNLLLELIKTPVFDEEEIVRQKEIQSREILYGVNSPDHARELVHQALFRNFPYSLNAHGTQASLAAMTQASVQNWYDTHVKNRKPVVIAIGDTKGTSLASYFVRHFSGSRMQDTKIPEEYVKALEKGESIKKNWERDQSLILIGFQAPPEDDEDGYAAAVLESYAGDQGRFAQEIRDRRGAAHGVTVIYGPLLRGGSMIVCASANPGNEEAVLKALQEEIRHVTEDPIPYRDYRSAVNAAVGAYWIRSQMRFEQIADIAGDLLAGKGIEAYPGFPANLQQVKEEDLIEAARRIFSMDKAVILRMQGRGTGPVGAEE